MNGALRVLVVDDSAFARKVVRDLLSAEAGIDVVGIARDGIDALQKIDELRPDVVTLDLMMPELDGVGVLTALADRAEAPRVVVVTTLDESSEIGLAALAEGAFALVQKPTAIATDRLYEMGKELVETVRAAAASPRGSPRSLVGLARAPADGAPAVDASPRAFDVVVIGASTGGPQAIAALIAALPASFPVPIAVVVHMPPGYTASFAERIDRDSDVSVLEAREGLELGPGRVVIARAGMHLKLQNVNGACRAMLDVRPLDTLHRPAVDVLFESAAAGWGARVLAVVLTGMGEDGAVGARAIRERGGRVLAEAESSCVVYGMPRAVAERGLASAVVPLERMAAAIAAAIIGAA